MKYEIKDKNSKVLFACEAETLRACVEQAVKEMVNLTRVNLAGANLVGAKLAYANLTGANLTGATMPAKKN